MNQHKDLKQPKSIGIKRTAFERAFAARFGFIFLFGKPVDHQPNRIGRLHSATLQLVGPADNPVSAALILPLSTRDPLSVIRARQYLKAFFDQVPDGENGPNWVEQNVYQATIEKEAVILHQGLNIALDGIATTDGLVMTLTITKV